MATNNNLVSVQQFTAASKVVGSIQQNSTLIHDPNVQDYHNQLDISSFTNKPNIEVSKDTSQNDYQKFPLKLLSPNLLTNTTTAQMPYTDGISQNNLTDEGLPNIPSRTLVHQHSQTIQRHSEKVVHNISTITDFDTQVNFNKKQTRKHSCEDSDDSSKSSLEDDYSLKKWSCFNACSNINMESNAAAMKKYLSRIQLSSTPQEIQQFLNKYNIKTDQHILEFKNRPIKDEDNSRFKLVLRISKAVDGSLLYCCSECQMTFPIKETAERHIAGHESDQKHECNVCGLCLKKKKEQLDQRKQGSSEERPFVCEICYKCFKRNEHLRRHFVIHSGDKNHLCVHCGKAFSRKDHLNKHLQTHAGKQIKAELKEVEPNSPSLPLQNMHS